MDKLFKEVKDGKLMLAVDSFKLKGKAKYVFAMIGLLTTTKVATSLSYPLHLRSN